MFHAIHRSMYQFGSPKVISLSTFITFYTAVMVIQLTPGPDMLLIIGRGIGQGRRAALMTAAGGTLLAGVIQVPILAGGVASLVQTMPYMLEVLRWIGATYLVWIGAKTLFRAKDNPIPRARGRSVSDYQALVDGMVSNLFNPKPLVFMLVFLPQFVDPANGWPIWSQLVLLGGIQKLSGFVINGAVAWTVGSIGGWLAGHPAILVWQRRFAGLVMISLGLRLAGAGNLKPVA